MLNKTIPVHISHGIKHVAKCIKDFDSLEKGVIEKVEYMYSTWWQPFIPNTT